MILAGAIGAINANTQKKTLGKQLANIKGPEGNYQFGSDSLLFKVKDKMVALVMNKRHWITIALTGEISDQMIIDLTTGSYGLVASKLTRADKSKLEQQS